MNAQHVFQQLTPREAEVLGLVAAGLSNKEIAAVLGWSPRTAAFHVGNLLHRLGAQNRTALAGMYVKSSGIWAKPIPRAGGGSE